MVIYFNEPITMAYFPFYELLDFHLRMKPSCLDEYPKLKAFLALFEALPSFKAYLSKESVHNLPLNHKSAAFK